MDFYVLGFWLCLPVLAVLAWRWRTRTFPWWKALAQPEVSVAMLMLGAGFLTIADAMSSTFLFLKFELVLLAIDFGLFIGLAIVGALSGKWWTLCAAALQLVSATAHIARLVTPGMYRLGYQVMEQASSYPLLVLLGWGIWTHRIATRKRSRSRRFSSARAASGRRPP